MDLRAHVAVENEDAFACSSRQRRKNSEPSALAATRPEWRIDNSA